MLISATLVLYALPALCLLVVVVQLYKLYRQRIHHQRLLKHFPGPKPHWLYGNAHQIDTSFQGLLKLGRLASEYGGVLPVWMGPTNVSLLSVQASTSRAILAGTDPKDEFSYNLLGPWMGEGLLLQSGRKWDRTRRLLTPAFHNDILKSYMKVFGETVKELVEKWRTARQPVEVFHHASLLTMDSMLRCLFGNHSHCQQERTRHPYIEAVYQVSDLIVKRLSKTHLMFNTIYHLTEDGRRFKQMCDQIHSYSRKLIQDRKELHKQEKPESRALDFLDILLTAKDSDGQGLNDQEIQDEVDTFMFAGHDSTASSLSWCLYNLAANPSWQTSCRKEANKILAGKKEFAWDDLKQLEMTTACIQESMRLYPAVPNFSRFTERTIDLPDGRVIPKNVRVAVSVLALHRDPLVWHQPEVFDPMRFIDRSQSSYMPFSMGPRSCIGKTFALTQLKIAVTTILVNFTLEVLPDRLPVPESSLILRSKDGLYLKISPL